MKPHPYNPEAKCPKCDNAGVSVRHCSRYWCSESPDGREHLHRTCGRCGYGWLEAPLDAEKEEHRG